MLKNLIRSENKFCRKCVSKFTNIESLLIFLTADRIKRMLSKQLMRLKGEPFILNFL